jgi:hypothetical protein
MSSGTVIQPPPLPELREARRERWLAAALMLLGLAAFGVAGALDPYEPDGEPRSYGTHRQLGLPACGFHSITGRGCPSCGMTTTFALLVHGDLDAAWRTNWAGCIIALMTASGTFWFMLVALGLPPGRFTADEVVKRMAVTGTVLAITRWVVIICGQS